jgi:hypothetical protein
MLNSNTPLGLDIQRITQGVATSAVRAYLNSLFPDEFEYYLFTLELLNNRGEVEDILIFPVMPNAISDSRVSLVNIRKTNNSVVSLTNTTFAPTNISIQGTFGKKIRLLLGSNDSGSAFSFSTDFNVLNKNIELNGAIKTGYGVTKMLERIIKKSQSSSEYLLFAYNHALNNNYLVECVDMNFSQSLENNMLWNYQLNFKSLARAEDVYIGGKKNNKKSINEQLAFSVINDGIFKLTRSLGGITKNANKALTQAGVL